MSAKPRLLIIEPRRLGDALLSLPLVRSALEAYDVYVCCPAASQPIFAALVPLSQIFSVTAPWEAPRVGGWFSRSFRGMVHRLNQIDFDCILSVWPDPRVHLWMNLIRSKDRFGYLMSKQNYYGWERPWRGRQLLVGRLCQSVGQILLRRPLLSREFVRSDRQQSHLENWHQFAEALQLEWKVTTPWFRPGSLPQDHPVMIFLQKARSQKRIIWLVHTGAHAPVRRWAPEKFLAVLATAFQREDVAVLIIHGPGESALASPYPWHLTHAPVDLPELFSLTMEVDRVLCHDSLMAHVAAALGKPVHTLFGAGNSHLFAPFQNRQRIIMKDICPHHPCFDRCVMPSPICIESITVEEVVRAVEGNSLGDHPNLC